jgi:predicted lipid-binding transport protein (Tim44 family)
MGRGPTVAIHPSDYQDFERKLVAVQDAFSREDLSALGRLATPEMVRTFGAELEANRARGIRNDVSGTRLLQGDLSESWQEGRTTYASVAMRFSAVDAVIDRASGRIVSGDPVHPVEATELWTFRREGGGSWILSAIQQAG